MNLEEEDGTKVSNYYGIWPLIAGLAFAALIIWFMFAFADGFA